MRAQRILAPVILLACAAVASAQVTDSIKYGKNLFKADIIVTAENWDKVHYKTTSGEEGALPADEIREIGYGDVPSTFRMALSNLNRRVYDQALDQFEAAAQDKSARSFWIGQQANYYHGHLLYRLGGVDPKNYARALTAYSQVEKAAPQGRFVPPARFGMGLCYLKLGDPKKAEEVFSGLADGRFGPKWTFRGKLGLVRVQFADAKTAQQAIQVAQGLVEEARGEDLRLEAKLVLAEACLAAGNHKEARKVFDDVARNAPEEEIGIKAAGYNGVGDCYRAEKDVQNALWAYLRVRCVYFEEPEETPRALEGLAWCFKQLRDTKRLREVVQEVKTNYANSVYAAKAESLMK